MKSAIYHIRMPNQYLLMSTFLRFQETYESPKFRGQGFTLEEFQDWYASTRPTFSYYDDWIGCNFPSSVVEGFTPERFGEFSKKERWVLDQLQHIPGKYYVIATFSGEDDAIHHEVVHGLFYLDESYAKQVADIVKDYQFTEFRIAMRNRGYCEEVMVDEINAYLLTGLSTFLMGMSPNDCDACRPKLEELFVNTFGFDISDTEQAHKGTSELIHHIDGNSVVDVHNR